MTVLRSSELGVLDEGGRVGLLDGEDHPMLDGDDGEPGGLTGIAG